MLEIVIVMALIALLAALAVPNFVRARKGSLTDACINNLRQIDGAKQQWALENGRRSSDTPTDTDLQPYLGRGDAGTIDKVYCPMAPTPGPMAGYTINSVGTPPVCNQYSTNEHPAILY